MLGSDIGSTSLATFNRMAITVLVTGAAGFIGSHVCERLLADGHEVVGLDSFDDFYDPSTKEENLLKAVDCDRFALVRGDIRDDRVLDALPVDVDVVVHLAARAGVLPSIENPVLYTDVNVMGTVRLLDWAARRGVERFVFASSSSVYGNNSKIPFSEHDSVDHPISPYAATKKAGELICHSGHHVHGMGVACLRLFTVYGPRQRPDLAIHKFATLLRDGLAIPVFGDGSTSRDYTFIDDTVDGILAAISWTGSHSHSFEIFNLGNSRTISLAEMIRTLADEMGVEPVLDRMPMQRGDVLRTYADIRRADEVLAYRPRTEFRDGLRAFLRWLDSRG